MVKILQLKIRLNNIKPDIWRRVEILDNITFYELHHTIQLSMGWWNEHLFKFTVGGQDIGIKDDFLPEFADSTKIIVSGLVNKKGQKFTYLYDFGDSWEHIIEVEDIFPPVAGKEYPVLTAGERNCPPENILGFPGYLDLMDAMKHKRSKRYKEYVQWLGEPFDPEHFDLEENNRDMQRILKIKKWYPN